MIKVANYDELQTVVDSVTALNTRLTSVESAISGLSIPSALSDLTDDAEHRTVSDVQIASWNQGGQSSEDVLLKSMHRPIRVARQYPFGTYGTVWDLESDGRYLYGCNSRTSNDVIKADTLNDNAWTVSKLSPLPAGKDATDKPTDMTDFYKSGSGWIIRNIAIGTDYIYLSARYGSGVQADGTHLYGGIIVVNKSTFTVAKSYWTLRMASRVVLSDDGTMLAVGNQLAGITFYSVDGSTLTQKAQFTYSQSTGSDYKGDESQCGKFYTDGTNTYYFNTGFGRGFIIYNVTDLNNITEVAHYRISGVDFPSGVNHTYTAYVDYPYAYLTSANESKTEAKSDYVGLICYNISDLENISLVKTCFIKSDDANVWNGIGDTKPTEMKKYEDVLVTNYEKGVLIFDISEKGNPKFCGRYSDEVLYGISTNDNGKMYVGICDQVGGSGYVNTYIGI